MKQEKKGREEDGELVASCKRDREIEKEREMQQEWTYFSSDMVTGGLEPFF